MRPQMVDWMEEQDLGVLLRTCGLHSKVAHERLRGGPGPAATAEYVPNLGVWPTRMRNGYGLWTCFHRHASAEFDRRGAERGFARDGKTFFRFRPRGDLSHEHPPCAAIYRYAVDVRSMSVSEPVEMFVKLGGLYD